MSEHQISKFGAPNVAVEFTQIGAMVGDSMYASCVRAFNRLWPTYLAGDDGRAVVVVQIVPKGPLHIFSACRGEYVASASFDLSFADPDPEAVTSASGRRVTSTGSVTGMGSEAVTEPVEVTVPEPVEATGELPVTIGDVEAISNALAGNAAASAAFGNMVGRLIEAENRAEYRDMARLQEEVKETRRLAEDVAEEYRNRLEAELEATL